MAVPEQYSLRWNDFYSNLSSGFHTFLEGEDLVDVTLAAEGHYVQAHKLILSVCSPYFKKMFKINPCTHPIVILKDVSHAELCGILHFMYKGEVNVRMQDLKSFLHTAELLQVKGLSVDRETTPEVNPVIPVESDGEITPNPPVAAATPASTENNYQPPEEPAPYVEQPVNENDMKSPLKSLLSHSNRSNNTPKRPKIKIQPLRPKVNSNNSTISDVIDCSSDIEQYDQICESDIEDMPDVGEFPALSNQSGDANCKVTGVQCIMCDRFFANRYNLKVHIRDKHDTKEGTLQCEICNKRMRNPSCLRVHMYHHRKQAAFFAQQTISAMRLASPVKDEPSAAV